MSKTYGPNVPRTLDAFQRAFKNVIFQRGKPPSSAELNLQDDVHNETMRELITAHIPSGFLLDPSNAPSDFLFNPLWSNLFKFGNYGASTDEVYPAIWANVNGWLVPVGGTNVDTEGDMTNVVHLNPPPSSDTRIDLVFLEVWLAQVAPNPSTTNKPSASTLWKFGNVEYGGTNHSDDLEDPAIGFETTERTQVQYRLRVHGSGQGLGASVDLANYPDGLGDPSVLGQGAAASPVGGMTFTNMRATLGDTGLYRAGNGDPTNDLGTVDGYVYAIPVAAVFRRNSSPYVAVNTAGNPNHNGAFNRNPSAATLSDPRDGAKVLTTATLTADITSSAVGAITVTSLSGSGLDEPYASLSNVFLVIDPDSQFPEIVGVSAVSVGGGTVTIPVSGRGRWGTNARAHLAGTPIALYNTRPDGLYSDEIVKGDVVDLRRGVSLHGWDYEQLLLHNLNALSLNDLQTTWKKSYYGETQGPSIVDVTYLDASGAIPNQAEGADMDGPDGVRTTWSDAAVLQDGVTLLLDCPTPVVGVVSSFDSSINWDVAPDFQPEGWLNKPAPNTNRFTNGAIIDLHIGGADGEGGARGTFRTSGTRAVRFVAPYEMDLGVGDTSLGNQHPWKLSFVNNRDFQPAAGSESSSAHPGAYYPLSSLNFEKPFLVLGGRLHSDFLNIAGCTVYNTSVPNGEFEVNLPGLDFDDSSWWDDGSTATSFAASAVVAAGGLGYNVGDLLFISGGTNVVSAVAVVTQVAATVVTTVRILRGGEYTATPGNPAATTTDGGGAGCTLTVTWDTGKHTLDKDGVTKPVLGVGRRTLYDMLTNGGRDLSGESSEVYLTIRGDNLNAENNGAFKIIGAGTAAAGGGYTRALCTTASRVRVRFLSEGVTQFVTASAKNGSLTVDIRSQHMNVEDGTGANSNDPSVSIVLTDIAAVSSTPWTAAAPPSETDSKLLVETTLLYHPGRAGIARIPTEVMRLSGISLADTFLRQSKATIDTTFSTATGAPNNETFFDVSHVRTWNRLSSLGLSAPNAPDYGGNIIASSEQDRESEAFVDYGSKTLMWRPFQDMQFDLFAHTISSGTLVPTTFNAVTTNPNSMWETTQTFGFALPAAYMPRFGRQDIPYHVDVASPLGSGTFLEGICHLFTDSSTVTDDVFGIIGGTNNGGVAGVNKVFGSTNIVGGVYGNYANILTTTQPAIGCRKLSDTSVYSSDVGKVLNGIELPPYMGIARLYAVYEWDDFQANGSAFEADRITPRVGATNLLRKDASKQTLFIRKGGASDITGNEDDHTYVITENSIDITQIPTYDSTNPAFDAFADFEYVVEFTLFGFSRGWINKNNYVRARNYHGNGTQQLAATSVELDPIHMVVPAAAPYDTALSVTTKRIPYQGDPFFTRGGSNSPTTTDYQRRYGELDFSDTSQLATPIEQFDSSGAINVETPYTRPLEVLASVDFYTTLGTGKLGGLMYSGTVADVAYTEDTTVTATRIPATASEPSFRVVPRAYTEGQETNTNHASLEIVLTDNTNIEGASVRFTVDGTDYVITEGGTWVLGADLTETATDLVDTINQTSGLSDKVEAALKVTAPNASVLVTAKVPGAYGNNYLVELLQGRTFLTDTFPFYIATNPITTVEVTKAYLSGGRDIKVNAGVGNSRTDLTGLTERLPLGILLQDHDFLCENPMSDTASSMMTSLSGVRPTTLTLPLTRNSGQEYTRLLGNSGESIALTEGAVHLYTPYTQATPTGTKMFRVNRGGSAYVLSNPNPGGPVDWVAGYVLQSNHQPVLKGGILLGKALLVRNFKEEAFPESAPTKTVHNGEELQMVILTYGRFGQGDTVDTGIDMTAIMSPTGWGEGYAASDRYRLQGRPMMKNSLRDPPALGSGDELALFDGTRI